LTAQLIPLKAVSTASPPDKIRPLGHRIRPGVESTEVNHFKDWPGRDDQSDGDDSDKMRHQRVRAIDGLEPNVLDGEQR